MKFGKQVGKIIISLLNQPYKFITIGNFYPDEDVSYTVKIDSPVPLHWGYYFIDKIVINILRHNDNTHKSLLKTLDILGRETNTNTDFQLHIYDDGSVAKKYVIK